MGTGKGKTDYLLSLIREGKQMTLGQQLRLTAYLSVPAIMAQISSIAMQYIDASMVGSPVSYTHLTLPTICSV